MSQRHRDGDPHSSPPKQELRARAHGERHRIHVELSNVAAQVSGGVDPADVHEPGVAWKPEHPRDPDVARAKFAKRGRAKRHWKQKMWKRRTLMRRRRAAEAMRLAQE